MKLRPYQTDAVESTLKAWELVPSVLGVAATGMGKTVMAAHIIKERVRYGRVMVVAHREELIFQAAKTIKQVTGIEPDIEMADLRASEHSLHGRSPIVISTIQTQNAGKGDGRMSRFNPDDFSLLWIDEAHHAVSRSYRAVIDYYRQNPNLKVLGVTATPDRTDEKALGRVFDEVAFECDIRFGVDDGWLVPIHQTLVTVEGLDLSACRTTAGDLNGADLAKVLEQERNMHEIAGPTIELACGRQTLVFTASLAQAERLTEIFNRHQADCARWVHGGTPRHERRKMLADYALKKFHILVNVGVATEGFDCPGVEVVVMARPTKSRSLYCLDDETEALTPSGWKYGKDLNTGDIVAAFDPSTGMVAWEPVLAHINRPLFNEEIMMEAIGPSVNIRVTNTHRMVYRQRIGRKKSQGPWAVAKAGDLTALSDFQLPVCGTQNVKGLPLSDAEIRFIGLVSTDGHINKKNGQAILYQNTNSKVYPEFTRTIEACGFKYGYSKQSSPTQFGERSSPLARWTISFGKPRGRDKHLRGWGELSKYMPKFTGNWDSWEEATESQWDALLESLHWGDGHKQGNWGWTQRSYHIAFSSKNWAEAIQSLSVRRGWRCSIAKAKNGPDSTIYKLHLKKTGFITLKGCKGDGTKLVKSERKNQEKVWCISVPSGAFLSRRHGKVVVVGNTQMLGRGTRPLAGVVDGDHMHGFSVMRRQAIIESAKPHVEVLDFVGNAGRHRLICSADILGGNMDDEVVEKAKKKTLDEPNRDIREVLAEAENEIAEAKIKAEAERRKKLIASAKYRTTIVSPFDAFGMRPWRERGWNAGKPLSEKMQAMLEKQGINTKGLTYTEAKQLIGEITRRWDSGQCSYKQAKILASRGLPTNVSREQARQMIDQIASQEGWKRPAPRKAEMAGRY